jgi:hypothetical protein
MTDQNLDITGHVDGVGERERERWKDTKIDR